MQSGNKGRKLKGKTSKRLGSAKVKAPKSFMKLTK